MRRVKRGQATGTEKDGESRREENEAESDEFVVSARNSVSLRSNAHFCNSK